MSVTWDGLDELKQALRELPGALTQESASIVASAAGAAADEVRAAYPTRSGKLAASVRVGTTSSPFGTKSVVITTAKYAQWFEFGSEARHNLHGDNRGRAPARPTFIPVMERRRRRMYDNLADVLTSHGLTVTGNG